MKNKVIAVIPARWGSKGIYKKNIRDIGGKPLIAYQVQNALDSKLIDGVVVATDSTEIADVVTGLFGWKVKIVMRPPNISGDLSKTEETISYVLDQVSADIVVTLEPTNPLNRTQYIDSCIRKVTEEGCDSAFCAVEDYGFFLDNPEELLKRPMRQQKKPRLREAGNCWVTKANLLWQNNNRVVGNVGIVIIPSRDAHGLDTEEDWHIIEALLRDRKYFTKRSGSRDYEEAYWGLVRDPDGNLRDRKEEKDIYLQRHKEKVDYLNKLSGRIIDVGCGYGFLLYGLNDNWEKFGVDISKLATGFAQQYGEIFCGTLEDAKYPDNHFDATVLNHIIEHVEDPVGLIREVRRILKPNGKLIIETPDFDSEVARRFGNHFRMLCDRGHISLFNQLGLYRLLTDNLFEIEKVSHPYFETDYFTTRNLLRLFDVTKISPPCLGNVVTFFAYKK